MGQNKNKTKAFKFYGSLAVIAIMLTALLINSYQFFSSQKVGAAIPFLAQETQLASSANVGNSVSSVGIDNANNVFTSWVGDDGSSDLIYGFNDGLTCSAGGGGGEPAIITKAGTDTSGKSTTTSATSLTFSHTLVSGSNRLVVVGVGVENNGNYDVASVTYGGVNMTKAVDRATGTSSFIYLTEIWYILEADLPSDGAQNVVITGSGTPSSDIEFIASASQYTGVNQGVPEATAAHHQTSGTTITNTISPSADAWVISVAGSGNSGSWTHNNSQVEILDTTGGNLNSSAIAVAELRGANGETSLASTYSSSVNRLTRVAASWTPAAGGGGGSDAQVGDKYVFDTTGENAVTLPENVTKVSVKAWGAGGGGGGYQESYGYDGGDGGGSGYGYSEFDIAGDENWIAQIGGGGGGGTTPNLIPDAADPGEGGGGGDLTGLFNGSVTQGNGLLIPGSGGGGGGAGYDSVQKDGGIGGVGGGTTGGTGTFINSFGAAGTGGTATTGGAGGTGQTQLMGQGGITGTGIPALAALSSTRVVFIDGDNDELLTYDFNGTSWGKAGDGLAISGTGGPALAALSSTRVAFIDGDNRSLRVYDFDGTNWTLAGSGLAISNTTNPALAALSSTRVAFIDSFNDSLRVYDFNGTSWSQTGNGLTISNSGVPALATLSSTRVAFTDAVSGSLHVYDFDGTNWSQTGNSLFISDPMGIPALAALSSTRVAFIDSTNDSLRVYDFDGTNWTLAGSGLAISNNNIPALTALSSTRVAFIDNTNDSLRVYSFPHGINGSALGGGDGSEWNGIQGGGASGGTYGGDGGDHSTDVSTIGGGGGGGGAGYFGGGGGSIGSGGGGGSSLVTGDNTTSTAGSGQTPPNTGDSDYVAGVGVGGDGGTAGAGTAGGPGLIVIEVLEVVPPGPAVLSTTTGGDLADPSMAMDKNGNFVVAWEGAGTGDSTGIFMQAFRFNSETDCYEAVGTETKVNASTTNTQLNPSVAIDYNGPSSGSNTRFIVAWESDHASLNDKDVYFQRYDVDFTQTSTGPSTVGSETRANTVTTDQQKQPAVTMNTLGEFVVAWFSDNSSNKVMYRPYAADGTALEANDVQINSATAVDGNIAAATDKKTRPASLNDENPRNFYIAYPALFSTPPSGTDDGIGIRKVVCVDPNTANGTDTDLACAVDDVEIIANDSLTGTQSNPAIDADNVGNFTVVWQNSVSGNADIMGQGFTDISKRNGSNFTLNNTTTGNQVNPSIAMNANGIYAVSFTSGNDNFYYYRAFDSEFAKIGNETIAHPSSTNVQQTVDTDIAPNGNHVQVWKDYTDDTIRFTLREFDNDATPIKENVQVDTLSTVSSDNPSVSFFKDTTGENIGKFVIVWQSDATTGGDGNDIYYRIYDAAGNAEAAAAIVNSTTTGEQVSPDVSAGYADTFSVGFISEGENDTVNSAYFDGASFSITTLQTCTTDCGVIRVAHDPATDRAAFAWDENSAVPAAPVVYTRKTLAGALNGSAAQVTGPDAEDEALPDVAFFDNGNKYTVVFTNAPGLSAANIYATSYNFNAGGNPTVATSVALVSAYTQSTGGQQNPRISLADDYGLITWTDFPTVSTDNNIYGQFFYNGAVMGPTFRINSTQEQNQSLPAVGTNANGEAVVAWEGYAGDDDYDIITQLLQNPFNLQEIEPFEPTARQEVQAGGQFLFVPDNITFPQVVLNTEDPTTQTVSVRDGTNGGDTLKYLEIQDATGADFTLTIQASNFFSAVDNRPYITNEAHFRVRNWDQSTTNVDNAGACSGDADLCFLTMDSSESSTAFALDSDTASFTFIDTQKVLGTKTGTVNSEIGRWRLYPEFEITVPPLIPPGVHQATITFTLT